MPLPAASKTSTWPPLTMEASHLPLLLDSEPAPLGTVLGHVARANPQWQRVKPDIEALAIFLGPNTYITPSWYPTKQQNGKVVPTWNYLAIHAYGALSFFDDADELCAHVSKMTDTHEALYRWLETETALERRRMIRESEQRGLRRSA